jgi:valyl-tRNA synthetase
MNPRYSSEIIEKEIFDFWTKNNLFVPTDQEKKTKAPYSILMPPPNITNILHLGHALNNTIQDTMTRYQRMMGKAAIWKVGVDHAGIATENMVEKQLASENLTKEGLGKELFLKRVEEWKDQYGSKIVDQLKRLGSSGDWDHLRFTMDEVSKNAVQDIFIKLYKDNLIYRGEYIINWCVRCLTALSDEEVEYEERQGELYFIKYHLEDEKDFLIVATTRPETMFGDVALAVHPDDERYKSYVGKKVKIPLVNKSISIIADETVEKDFGTGVLKITPFHSIQDFAVGKRHHLPFIEVIDEHGVMKENTSFLKKKERFEARKEFVKQLEIEGFIQEIRAHNHSRGVCYRCSCVVENRVSRQWFVKMESLAKPALDVFKEEKISFTPKKWEKVYTHWLNNIKDWCISRQIWWGHPIPAYHCVNGHINVSKTPVVVCAQCGSHHIVKDPDVLDTWFSSWIWPLTTFGWPLSSKELETFYPTQFLATAPEIIFFWVARMVMLGIYMRGEVPFKEVFFNSTICDMQGRKMSKSLGNGIDPLEIIQEYGADTLRFTLLFLAPKGERIRLDKKSFELGYKFVNKLWNAARFVLTQEGVLALEDPSFLEKDDWDKAMLYKLNEITVKMHKAYEQLDYFEMAHLLYHFFWNDFCDWYLESAKIKLGSVLEKEKSAKYSLIVFILEKILRLTHPIIPFITEYIWQLIPYNEGKNLIKSSYPLSQKEDKHLKESFLQIEHVKNFILSVRNLRADLGFSAFEKLSIEIDFQEKQKESSFFALKEEITFLARIKNLEKKSLLSKEKGKIVIIRKDYSFAIKLPENFDIAKEKMRLSKELSKIEFEMNRALGKLENEKFVKSAQKELIEIEKEKLVNYKEQQKRILQIINVIEK